MNHHRRATAPSAACIPPIVLTFEGRSVELVRDSPDTSSDGGVVLLREVDDQLGLTASMSALLGDTRDSSRVRHARREQFQQRVYQIALGHQDCNDADWLRKDAALRLACGAEHSELSSQPTLSRFENAITGRALNRLWRAFEQLYVDELDPTTPLVVLDVDSTDDPTHGDQPRRSSMVSTTSTCSIRWSCSML